MFTGIVNGQGEIVRRESRSTDTRFTIRLLYAVDKLVVGESIAVNGVCLTVETEVGKVFTAYASAETLSRTTLGVLQAGSRVNLERALAVGDRLGGHIVSGHVDCVASVLAVTPEGESRRIRIGFPETSGPEVIAKGSVALDGISLTINACGMDFLEVNVIPETLKETTAGLWLVGRQVNMETDMIGKYVRRTLESLFSGSSLSSMREEQKSSPSGMSLAFLRENGFF